jgi:hypothetical protein
MSLEQSRCQTIGSFHHFDFFSSEKKLFPQKVLAGQNRAGKKGGQGRVERVQEIITLSQWGGSCGGLFIAYENRKC